jgi:plastocyanin
MEKRCADGDDSLCTEQRDIARAHEAYGGDWGSALRTLGLVTAVTLGVCQGIAAGGDITGLIGSLGATNERKRADPRTALEPNDVVVWVQGVKNVSVPPTSARMSQRNIQFSPRLLVVVAGQTVDMPNEDDLAHNVYSHSTARGFDLGIYPKGETKRVTFDQVGLVEVRCSMHRVMRANILVVPNPYYALTAVGSRYQITGIPLGQYIVSAWKQSLAEVQERINVPETGEVVLDLSLGAVSPP